MQTVLQVMIWVFLGAAALLVTFGPAAVALNNLDLKWPAWVGVWLWTILCIGLVAGGIALYVEKHPGSGANDCADRGGVWSVTSSHMQKVGSVWQRVKEYGCVEVPQ